uniref:Uncharacterized protein n=1 Tax=Micrurus lemniscatus lemniscatus TaxID=129467 RepID=A0A2D4HAP5_MICLE
MNSMETWQPCRLRIMCVCFFTFIIYERLLSPPAGTHHLQQESTGKGKCFRNLTQHTKFFFIFGGRERIISTDFFQEQNSSASFNKYQQQKFCQQTNCHVMSFLSVFLKFGNVNSQTSTPRIRQTACCTALQ